MSYKHWTSDESSWNKNPIPVFNEVPSLVALQPRGLAGKLRTVVSGWEEMLIAPVVVVPVIKKLRECVAHPQFTDLELMCHVDQECPRCGVFRGFVETRGPAMTHPRCSNNRMSWLGPPASALCLTTKPTSWA
jgi:hypothetical protein